MRILLCALLLVFATTVSFADTQSRKSAQGDVDCQTVDEGSALDSETTDQPVPNAEPSEDNEESASEREPGGRVGDETSQSREPGITY